MLCEPRTNAEGRTVFDARDRTLVDDAVIDWGRDDPWTQPEPATLKFTVFDPSRHWINLVSSRRAVGTGCTMSVQLPAGTTRPDMPNGTFTLFQGFVSNVKLVEHRAETTAGPVNGHLVTITAGDRTSLLGNVMLSWEDWPAERMIDRAIRIRDRSAGVGIRQIYYEAAHKDGPVRAIELRDDTAITAMRYLFQSFAHQWTYSQNRNVVIRIPEHKFTERPIFAVAPGSDDVIIRMPDMADWTGTESPIDRAPHSGTGLDGAVTQAEVNLDSDQISAVTRAEVEWIDRHSGVTVITVINVAGSTEPRRSLAFESWYSDGLQVDPILSAAADKAFWDQSGPHHPNLVTDTRIEGGFATVGQGIALLSAAETRGYIYVNGSPWFEAMGRVPVVAPSGGRITYTRGRWRIETKVLSTATTYGRGELTWSQLDQRIAWGHPHAPGTWQFGGVHWWDLSWPNSPTVYQLT